MPLIICPDCGKEVSDTAPTCPQCGRPMKKATATIEGTSKEFKKRQIYAALVAIGGLIIFIASAALDAPSGMVIGGLAIVASIVWLTVLSIRIWWEHG